MNPKSSLISLLLCLASLFSRANTPQNDQLAIDRISFVFNLKKQIASNGWKRFSLKKYEVPLIYYTDSSTYVANPTTKFLSIFDAKNIYSTQELNIFKINHLIDSIPFHMETAIVNSSDTNIYNHQSPFMQCSSVEIVKQKIPDLKNTEEWITMIIHEYFHGFQYKHKKFADFTTNNIYTLRIDSLVNLYKKYDWFKKSVDLENEYLLQIIQEKDTKKIDSLVQHFFIERNARRLKTKEVVNLDLELYEKYYETIEGTARYTEYGFYKTFSEMPQNAAYLPNDTYFQSFKNYQNYQITKDKWLYMTSKTSYLYAIGFNMARAMDKLNIDFKNVLFANEKLTLEDIFKSK